MKNILLILSFIFFCITLGCGFFTGWIGAIIFTVLSIAGIVLTVFLMKNVSSAKWGAIIIILILSIFLMKITVGICVLKAVDHTPTDKIADIEEIEDVKDDDDMIITDVEEEETKTDEETVKVVEKEVPVEKVVERVVEKRVEVPVEKIVEKTVTEYVEVPVVEYVEVEIPTTPTQTTNPNTTPQYNYNNPTGMNYGYTGDPTVPNSYGYGNVYNYGDPTINNSYYYGQISISGNKTVTMGESVMYTISGVSSISKSNLKLPKNVYVDKISGNKVYLVFEQVGWYSIGYGNATINVKVEA